MQNSKNGSKNALNNTSFIKQDQKEKTGGFDEEALNDILGSMQEASPDTRKNKEADTEEEEEVGSPSNPALQQTHLSIDINDSMQLEAQGLKRVQIEGYKS